MSQIIFLLLSYYLILPNQDPKMLAALEYLSGAASGMRMADVKQQVELILSPKKFECSDCSKFYTCPPNCK